MKNDELFTVIFYERDNGKVPVAEFLASLDVNMEAEAVKEIDFLEEHGIDLREPHVKFIRNGIYELRISFDNNKARILYFFVKGKNIILTNGFIKKTNKTPIKEIETALDYKNNYKDRMKE